MSPVLRSRPDSRLGRGKNGVLDGGDPTKKVARSILHSNSVITRPTRANFRRSSAAQHLQSALLLAVLCAGVVLPLLLLASLYLPLPLRLPDALCLLGNNTSSSSAGGPNALLSSALLHRDLTDQKGAVEKTGNVSYYPSFGIFPAGCKWREVHTDGSAAVTYEYWNYNSSAWSSTQPSACTVNSLATGSSDASAPSPSSARSSVDPHKAYTLYRNLWYNNGRWYVLVDGPEHVAAFHFSRNHKIQTLHLHDAAAFARSVRWRFVPGDTLLFDFVFFVHPTAIGHWWEMLSPLFSILKTIQFKRPCDQMVLLHLKRVHFMEWVRAMLAVSLGTGIKQSLPPVLLQQETANIFHQLTMRLEGVGPDEWLVFERALIVRDLHTGGGRTFLDRADGREFRGRVYQQYGLPHPELRKKVPRTITFQRKRANRRVLNEEGLIAVLQKFGKVQVVEFNSSTSFYEQLLYMKDTGVYVSVHTSNLANAPLLQPGSAVVEIIQRHWVWNGLDTSFRDQTLMVGDIHHYAWRATKVSENKYLNPADERKYTNWTSGQCYTEDCVEAHTNVDVYVNLEEFEALLRSRLPLVFKGYSRQKAELPWPKHNLT